MYPLNPTVAQGTGQGDRIGNQINLRSAWLKISILAEDTALGASIPRWFDLFIFKNKRAQTTPTSADMLRFMQLGNNAISYNGDILNSMSSVNQDRFTLKLRKRFALMNAYTVNNQQGSAGPMARSLYFNVTKFLAKKLKYDEGVTQPMNDNLYFAVGCADAKSGAGLAQYATMAYVFEFRYSDP